MNTISAFFPTHIFNIKKFYYLLFCTFLFINFTAFAYASEHEKNLIMYYSRTGKSKFVCEVLKKHIPADVIEIKDQTDRSGTLGYLGAGCDAMFNKSTDIQPKQTDLSEYANIIVIGPIWYWKLCTPIKTLFEDTSFNKKKLVLITTATGDLFQYDVYGDDAPFVKRYLRDYLKKKRATMETLIKNSGAEFIGHFHVAMEKFTDKEITENILKFVPEAKEKILPQLTAQNRQF